MIYSVEGDILLSGAELLVHGVAPHDDFHSGLALELRTRWPSMYKDFRHFCRQTNPHPGGVWLWGGPAHVRIAALLTQEPNKTHHGHPGKAKLKHVNHSLRKLAIEVEKEGFTSLAIPKIATGVGGLDWGNVKPQIEHHLKPLGIPIYIYEAFHAGQKADEQNLPPRSR